MNTVNNPILYSNAATEINAQNNLVSLIANTKYLNAKEILKSCRDISYSVYLLHTIAKIYTEQKIDADFINKRGNILAPLDQATLDIIASSNSIASTTSIQATTYLSNTTQLITNALSLTNDINKTLSFVSAFNTLVKSICKTLSDPLSQLISKTGLHTSSQILENESSSPSTIFSPTISINDSMSIASIAYKSLSAFTNSLLNTSGITNDITNSVLASTALADSLDIIARTKNAAADVALSVAKFEINIARTLLNYGTPITITDLYDPNITDISSAVRISAIKAYELSQVAEISASNARYVSNALINLKNAYINLTIQDNNNYSISLTSLNIITDMITSINTILSNTSVYRAIPIIRRSYNTILGQLEKTSQDETVSINLASGVSDIHSLLLSLSAAIPSTIPTSIISTQKLLWLANSVKEEAEKQSKLIEHSVIDISTNVVSSDTVLAQTTSAIMNGIRNKNYTERMSRISNSLPAKSSIKQESFKAILTAKRPEDLVYRINNTPLRLDSIRDINTMRTNITQQTQHINDASKFSLTKQ